MNQWWKGAVVYQIYPRSFCDTNGDGIGDLNGIASKLGYVADLGVDAIWLSPIHPSPNRDWGYDVADYCAIDPALGTLKDFERLLAEAHRLGLKVILDEVISHTSDEHPWFIESRSSRDNSKADWYEWADPKLDGAPPNNWAAAFGGPAWSYWPERRQCYFHKFLRQQPKLNLHNPQALAAVLDVFRFWFDRGVDGFRLDVAHSFLHDRQLRDNPAVPIKDRRAWHWSHQGNLQEHIFDNGFPEDGKVTPAHRYVLDRIRDVSAEYADRFVFGEFAEEPRFLGGFCGDAHGVHSGYTFAYIWSTKFRPQTFAGHIGLLNGFDRLFPCVTFSNHDSPRTVTRFGGGRRDDALAKIALTLLASLKGTVLLYQGEELGLGDAPIARTEIRDPFGDLYYPLFKGRDPCRTPMPWAAAAPHAGFSNAKPWLPVAPEHGAQAADSQIAAPQSVLNHARKFLRDRKNHESLRTGAIEVLQANDAVLAFERAGEGGRMLCVFNLSRAAAAYDLGARASWAQLDIGVPGAHTAHGHVQLPPLTTYFAIAP